MKIVALRGAARAPRELTSSYVWKTAYSVTLDEIRRARWRFERSMEDEAMRDSVPGNLPDPESAALSRRIRSHIGECLKGLDTWRRRAVVLRLTGFDRTEAAEMLGKSVKQVDNLTHRGMQDLRACLRAKGVTP